MTENHGLDTQLLALFLKKRFHDEKPVDIISVEVKNAVPKGENYASMVYRVKMGCLTAQGRRRNVSMIVKTELQSKETKEIFSKALPVFAVETRIYTTILPIMEELMEEFGDKREKMWGNILGFKPYNLIAFEDLLDKGYIGAQRRNSLDFNHSKLVLRDVARFHAMGMVLLERGLITPDDKGKLFIAAEDPFAEAVLKVVLTVVPDAMDSHWGDDWKQLAEKIRNQRIDISSKLVKLANDYDKRFEVFNHGDLWTCNMLFKYLEHEDNFPVSVKFVDFQMCNINSFIWDVVYFLNTCTVPNVRRSRLGELLEIYQLALEKNLQMFKYSGYIPNLDDVKSEWKRVEYAHLVYILFHPFAVAETTTAFDLEKILTHQPHEVVDQSVCTDGKAMTAIGEDLKNLDSAGLL